MKFSTKKFGSIATAAVLAGTMAFMPMTALAADSDATTNYGTNQTIEKVYSYGNTPLAAQDFTFSLVYKKADKVGTNDTAEPTKKDGQDGKATITTPASDDTPNDKQVSNSANLIDLVNEYKFTKPGEYTFELSEKAGTNPNISYDKDTKYTVRVDVVWDDINAGTVKINGIALLANGQKTDKATFTNNSNAASGDFTVSKKVSGTAANTNDYFKYTLQLTNPSQVSGSYEVMQDGASVATLDAENSYTATFYLKSGESVSVTGLPKGTAYTVTEGTKVVSVDENGNKSVADDAADNGYDEKYTVNSGDQQTGTEETGTVQDNTTSVAFENEKGFIPQTGITMNTLPFAVVATVAVAGGAALVISRRRHAGEDF
jgi:pilin isopeptide linkage protein/LPXTG-motif cell wall-anchored protein